MLEKFTGVGTLLIAGAGNFIELNPAKYGGKIQVHTGCLVAFEDTVTLRRRADRRAERADPDERSVRRQRLQPWRRSKVTVR